MNLAGRLLPEFYLDKHDSGALASGAFTALYAHNQLLVLFLFCGAFIAAALALVAIRARLLGLRGGSVAAAVALVAIALSGRLGVGFDAPAWFFMALLLAAAAAGTRYRWYLPAIVALWSLLLDSGTIGAAIVVLQLAGTLVDERRFTAQWRSDALVAAASVAASLLSAGGVSFAFHGARAFYFDMLLVGADRQPLWASGPTLAAIAVCAIVVLAATAGIARKNHNGEVCVFLALLVSAVLDARMVPFFAIAVVPPLLERYRAIVPLRIGAPAMAVCLVAAFVSPVASDAGTAGLLASLSRDHRPHRIVCVKPSWCNPVLDLQSSAITALAIGIPETSSAKERLVQKRISDDPPDIVREMDAAHADTLIATDATSAAGLLVMTPGWRVLAQSGDRFAVGRSAGP